MPLKESIKNVLRPVARLRFKYERALYNSATILTDEQGNTHLAKTLRENQPTAIAKIGASELGGIRHYLARKNAAGHVDAWGNHQIMLYRNAGVFPPDPTIHSRFAREYLDALRHINVLCVWFRWGERSITKTYSPQATYVRIRSLEPYYFTNPWSAALEGKRVLVITPFAQTVLDQYRNRKAIWARNPAVLPDFQLETLRAPLSAALVPSEDKDWFVTLDRMKAEMDQRNFDVAIIGAGTWSLPLAAHARKLGRWGLHLGGPTQILFGIKGGRWDNNSEISSFVNDAWVRPSDSDRPKNHTAIEGGCYW